LGSFLTVEIVLSVDKFGSEEQPENNILIENKNEANTNFILKCLVF